MQLCVKINIVFVDCVDIWLRTHCVQLSELLWPVAIRIHHKNQLIQIQFQNLNSDFSIMIEQSEMN